MADPGKGVSSTVDASQGAAAARRAQHPNVTHKHKKANPDQVNLAQLRSVLGTPEDWVPTYADVAFWATGIAKSATTIGARKPMSANLADMITGIQVEAHISGANQVTVTLFDEDWLLLDSGFFSANDDPAKLTKIEVNYPEHSRYWWRLSQCSPAAGYTITLTFIDRVAAALMEMPGPIIAQRAKMTRAEFFQDLCFLTNRTRLPPDGHIEFHSFQIDKVQPIQQPNAVLDSGGSQGPGTRVIGIGKGKLIVPASTTTDASKQANQQQQQANQQAKQNKSQSGNDLQVCGKNITDVQKGVANTLLQVCDKYSAPLTAAVALIYAAIGETRLGAVNPYVNNSAGAIGVLQGTNPYWDAHPRDVVGQATCFLLGNKAPPPYSSGLGFGAGTNQSTPPGTAGMGAIDLVAHGMSDPMHIAVAVEQPSVWGQGANNGNAYAGEDPHLTNTLEAQLIANIGGAGVNTSGEQNANYTFQIGTTQNPHEDYWTGMQRLANDVAWSLFIDGNRIYYDSQRTLISRQPALVIDRDDEIVADWSYDWENRNIATQFRLVLFADAFNAIRPGDVVLLSRFGPGSLGSTVTPKQRALSGRWLVADVQPGDVGALTREFTLIQPTMPKNEPAVDPGSNVSVPSGGSTGIYAIQQAAGNLKNWQAKWGKIPGVDADGYIRGGGHGGKKPLGRIDDVSGTCGHGLDCSGLTCWALLQGGYFKHGVADASGPLMNEFQPGQGQWLTIWTNAGHAFLELNPPGGPHMQLNTATSTIPWYQPWGGIGQSDAKSGAFTARHPAGT